MVLYSKEQQEEYDMEIYNELYKKNRKMHHSGERVLALVLIMLII